MSELQLSADQLTGRASTHVQRFDPPGFTAHPVAATAFLAMRAEAAKADIDLTVASAFRDFDGQIAIWNRKFRGERVLYAADGSVLDHASLDEPALVAAILEWSALPGASRHHWGSEFDVYDRAALPPDYKLRLMPDEYEPGGVFATLTQWLDANMARYGFFRPYDAERGGIHAEPWHISFAPVSVPALAAMSVAVLDAALDDSVLGLATVRAALPAIYTRQVCLVADAPAQLTQIAPTGFA